MKIEGASYLNNSPQCGYGDGVIRKGLKRLITLFVQQFQDDDF
jgi:hypothetical protein